MVAPHDQIMVAVQGESHTQTRSLLPLCLLAHCVIPSSTHPLLLPASKNQQWSLLSLGLRTSKTVSQTKPSSSISSLSRVFCDSDKKLMNTITHANKMQLLHFLSLLWILISQNKGGKWKAFNTCQLSTLSFLLFLSWFHSSNFPGILCSLTCFISSFQQHNQPCSS